MSATRRKSPRPGSAASTTGSRTHLTPQDEADMDQIVPRPESARSRTAWNEESGVDNAGFDRPSSRGDDMGRMEDDQYPAENLREEKVDEEVGEREPGCFEKFRGGVRSIWMTRDTEDTKISKDIYIKTTLKELIVYLLFLIVLCVTLWATKLTEDTKNQEILIKTTLRELIVYILYLIILGVLTFGMTNSNMYYYTKVMMELFLDNSYSDTKNTFRGSSQISDFWRFAEGPLMDGLYWETWYNNRNVSKDELGYIFYENKLLGVPRIRQLKVRNGTCQVEQTFAEVIDDCYGAYCSADEDHDPFGLKGNGTAWNYHTSDELGGSGHYGVLTRYEGGGYIQDLATTKAKSLSIVKTLKDNLWIDRGTRVVFTDFTVYNANINLFCVIRLVYELSATGGAIPSWSFRTVKLIRYVSVSDYFVMACECIFILFIIYYIIEEALEIKKHKLGYFKHFWNVIDILVLIISVVCIAFSIYRTMAVNSKLESLLEEPEAFPDFEFLSYWQMQFNSAVAVTVFFAWVKVFKYISFNKTMTQLSSTLSRCAGDLAGFLIMFGIIFVAFAQLGVLVFGSTIRDFMNFWNAVFTLFRIILGDFDYYQLEAYDKIQGPLYFFMYVFFVFFILLNMFLAIINDTYSEVKADIALQKNDFEMTEYFKKGYMKMMDKLNFKRDKIVDIQKALANADMNSDMVVDFDEWRMELKKRGYADTEIEALFAKYDTDGDRVLDVSEQNKMTDELEGQKAQLDQEAEEAAKNRPRTRGGSRRGKGKKSLLDDELDMMPGDGVTVEEFTVLVRRVDRMEHSIGSIVSKIDAVLVKLEAMERAKLKRRETMAKILDSITENDGGNDEEKKEHMEQLVRDELEKWDNDDAMSGASPSGSAIRSLRTNSSSTASTGYHGSDF